MISPEGIELILSHEGFKPHPYWPGGGSGITIGYGYDLGYCTLADLRADWLDEGRMTCPDLASQHAIIASVGKRAAAALIHLSMVKTCEILEIDARLVFEQCSLPKYEAQTRTAFPGVEDLPQAVQDALVSLVYNRGPEMGRPDQPSWERRREMREIRQAVADMNLAAIADALRRMKRLWEGEGLGGLLTRREKEAAMVESAIA